MQPEFTMETVVLTPQLAPPVIPRPRDGPRILTREEVVGVLPPGITEDTAPQIAFLYLFVLMKSAALSLTIMMDRDETDPVRVRHHATFTQFRRAAENEALRVMDVINNSKVFPQIPGNRMIREHLENLTYIVEDLDRDIRLMEPPVFASELVMTMYDVRDSVPEGNNVLRGILHNAMSNLVNPTNEPLVRWWDEMANSTRQLLAERRSGAPLSEMVYTQQKRLTFMLRMAHDQLRNPLRLNKQYRYIWKSSNPDSRIYRLRRWLNNAAMLAEHKRKDLLTQEELRKLVTYFDYIDEMAAE